MHNSTFQFKFKSIILLIFGYIWMRHFDHMISTHLIMCCGIRRKWYASCLEYYKENIIRELWRRLIEQEATVPLRSSVWSSLLLFIYKNNFLHRLNKIVVKLKVNKQTNHSFPPTIQNRMSRRWDIVFICKTRQAGKSLVQHWHHCIYLDTSSFVLPGILFVVLTHAGFLRQRLIVANLTFLVLAWGSPVSPLWLTFLVHIRAL